MADLETRLRGELSERAAGARGPGPASLSEALGATVAHRRRRDRLVLGAAVVGVLALVATGVALRLGSDEGSTPVVTGPDGGASQWVPTSESPLSPRTKPLAFTIGDEAFFFGGQILCPDGTDCAVQAAADGAAYDTADRTWREVADLPVGLTQASAAVMGGRAYVWGEYIDGVPCPADGRCSSDTFLFLVYDPGDDSWTSLPLPSEVGFDVSAIQAGEGSPRLTTEGQRVIAAVPDTSASGQGSSVVTELAYEPPAPACSPPGIGINCRAAWSELPVDPLRPSTDRTFVGHDGDLYLFATDPAGDPKAAVLREGVESWERLADPPFPAPFGWFLVGDEIVSPSPAPTSGIPADAALPAPPAVVFDTRTGRWVDPPDLPYDESPVRDLALPPTPTAAGPRFLTVAGLVLDLPARRWTTLPDQPGAADEGAAATWVGDTLVVWGGQDPSGVGLASGATWSPTG